MGQTDTTSSETIRKLGEFLKNDENVIFALLFGSTASNKQNARSDIDVGIYFKNPPEGLILLDYITSLSSLTGRDIDVAVLNSASAFLRHQVMKNKLNLTIKDRLLYRTFRENTMTDYDEYKYISGMAVHDR